VSRENSGVGRLYQLHQIFFIHPFNKYLFTYYVQTLAELRNLAMIKESLALCSQGVYNLRGGDSHESNNHRDNCSEGKQHSSFERIYCIEGTNLENFPEKILIS
jgi:hypothetical protein